MIVRKVAALLGVFMVMASPALAVTPKASYNDIEDEVMCVSCNVPLNIAESAQADQEKAELRQLVAQGLTKKQIKAQLVEIYGDRVLAEPKKKGFALFAWIVPIGAALALAGLGFYLLPRWRERRDIQAQAERDADEAALDPADAARVDADMARLGV